MVGSAHEMRAKARKKRLSEAPEGVLVRVAGRACPLEMRIGGRNLRVHLAYAV